MSLKNCEFSSLFANCEFSSLFANIFFISFNFNDDGFDLFGFLHRPMLATLSLRIILHRGSRRINRFSSKSCRSFSVKSLRFIFIIFVSSSSSSFRLFKPQNQCNFVALKCGMHCHSSFVPLVQLMFLGLNQKLIFLIPTSRKYLVGVAVWFWFNRV